MTNENWKDALTPLERKVYRSISLVALAVVFYCVLLLRKYPASIAILVIAFVALVLAAIFGGGYSKSVRVLDLRRFDKHADGPDSGPE